MLLVDSICSGFYYEYTCVLAAKTLTVNVHQQYLITKLCVVWNALLICRDPKLAGKIYDLIIGGQSNNHFANLHLISLERNPTYNIQMHSFKIKAARHTALKPRLYASVLQSTARPVITLAHVTANPTAALHTSSNGVSRQFGQFSTHHLTSQIARAKKSQTRMVSTGKNYVGISYPQPTPEVINKTRKNVFDLFSLKGKVASISGSSGGIGYDVAEAYAQAGADVAIWYNSRNPEAKVEYLQKEYGIKAKAYKVAINQYNDVEKAIQQQIKDFGKIDIFVANAGVIWSGEPEFLDEKDNSEWDKVMRINVDGVYYCAKAVGKHFRERGQGNFIITGSMSGRIVNVPDTMAAYCTSKAAVVHLGKSLALEWAKFARVNVVSPGYMKTDMTEAKEAENIENWGPITPMARMGDTRELVGTYLYLASDASSYTTGSDIIVDGGYSLM